MAWTKPKPMLKHERELWREAVLDAAEDDDEILRIAKSLQTAVDLQRGRSSGLGEQGALELLAALGVWLGENGGAESRLQRA